MKTFYFLSLSLVLFQFNSPLAAIAADDSQRDTCLSFSSRRVGADQSSTMPETCPAQTINNASAVQVAKGNWGPYYLEVYGHNKMIFFQRSGIASTSEAELMREGQISGDQTLFGEITELMVSENGLFIYVLSRLEGGVYTFEIGEGGNIAPIRYFLHSALKNAQNINWDGKRKMLTVDSIETGERIFLNPLADQRGRLQIHHQIIIDDLTSKL